MIDIHREEQRVKFQCQRAEKEGMIATLSLSEWIFILNHFEERCAYCGGNFEVMEHIIPLSSGGGTLAQNVVPACGYCNIVKDRFKATNIVRQETINKVQEELARTLGTDSPEPLTYHRSPSLKPQMEAEQVIDTSHLFSLDKIAEWLDVSFDVINKYRRNGDLNTLKVGRTYFCSQEDIDTFIQTLRKKLLSPGA